MISDIVAVSVLVANAASPLRQGFGTPLLAAYFDPTTHWGNTGDRVRFYSPSSALATLITDGFGATHPIYRAFQVALSQSPTPLLLGLGRRALPMTQVLKIKLLDVGVGNKCSITVIGTDGVAFVRGMNSTGVPATDAATMAALLPESTIGTVTVSTDTITITQVPGSLTDLQSWTPNLAIANATADPGIAADLTAIQAANTLGWYGLSLTSNSSAEVQAAAAWCDATGQGGKWGFFDNSDTINVNGTTPNLFTTLQGLTRKRCHVTQSDKAVLSCAGFGLAAEILAMSPGSYNVAFKSITGVIADDDASMTETQQLTLNTASTSQPGTGGQNGNWYKTVSGLNITFPGVTPSGAWVDQGIMNDWLAVNCQADAFAYLAGLPKVPLTDIGIEGVFAVIRSRIKTGSQPPFGGIDPNRPITVTGPTAASMSITDRNNRHLSGIAATFFYAGAVNTTTIQIFGSP